MAAACSRGPLTDSCPGLAEGALVITEIRGSSQEGTYGEWIEVYNAGSSAVDLGGVRLEWDRDDLETGTASETRMFVVHLRGVLVSPGAYAVLGRFETGAEPNHVDYGYLPEDCLMHGCEGDYTLYNINTGTTVEYDRASLSLWACDTMVDRVDYLQRPTKLSLPDPGTWGLDGSIEPTAQSNDDLTSWCQDADETNSDPTQTGIRGTPGEKNRTCG